jgi:hypothetical protein
MRAAAVLFVCLAALSPALADESVAERIAEIRPEPEAWQQVPWRTDLGQARREAAAVGRPLFVWAMNGNPLGCT